jgi:hypothetical protein
VIEAVHSSKEEGDFLPFWKLYIEQNYRGRWVRVGKFSLKNFDGRTFIADSNGILISDATCAKKVGMAVDRVKAIIADAFHDYADIGEERHKREVIPIIRKALEGKVPIPEGQYPKWPRPPIYQAFAVALSKFGKKDPKRSVEKALKEAEKRLKWVERNRRRFDPEDYRRERGYALLWIRLYQLVLKRLDAIASKEGKLLFKIDEKAAPEYEKEAYKYVKERLVWNGIPFMELDGKILVHKSDYEKAVKAIANQRVW